MAHRHRRCDGSGRPGVAVPGRGLPDRTARLRRRSRRRGPRRPTRTARAPHHHSACASSVTAPRKRRLGPRWPPIHEKLRAVPLQPRENLRLFPTVVGTFDVSEPELLAHVTEQILARSSTTPTVPRGERTGWQSAADLLGWTPQLHALGELLSSAVAELAGPSADGIYLAAWANVLRRGDYFTPHTHAGCAWSAVLYVDAGDSGPDHGGALAFRDPRAGADMVRSATNAFDHACTFHILPRTGMLVVFPAWLVHWVVPYQGERPRISVAANV